VTPPSVRVSRTEAFTLVTSLDPRVDDAVREVCDEHAQQRQKRKEQERTHQERVIAVVQRLERGQAHGGIREDLLEDDARGEDGGHPDDEAGVDGQQRVAADVADRDAGVADTPEVADADVPLPEFADAVTPVGERAAEPGDERGDDGQCRVVDDTTHVLEVDARGVIAVIEPARGEPLEVECEDDQEDDADDVERDRAVENRDARQRLVESAPLLVGHGGPEQQGGGPAQRQPVDADEKRPLHPPEHEGTDGLGEVDRATEVLIDEDLDHVIQVGFRD
jgi:hypothetical protein